MKLDIWEKADHLNEEYNSLRLVMNFIQRRADLPLTKVHKGDSKEYLLALKKAKDTGDLSQFRNFMAKQHIKTIQNEIASYKRMIKKDSGFGLIL